MKIATPDLHAAIYFHSDLYAKPLDIVLDYLLEKEESIELRFIIRRLQSTNGHSAAAAAGSTVRYRTVRDGIVFKLHWVPYDQKCHDTDTGTPRG